MDITDNFGLEFLDLTDVDEYERNRVLSSLQPWKPSARFPWFIGEDKTTSEGIKSSRSSQSTANHTPNYIPSIHEPHEAPTSENGFVVPFNNKTELLNDPQIINDPLINTNQYYHAAVPQYYQAAPPVATTHYITPASIYPTYIPPVAPVYYGVPTVSQPLFIPSQPIQELAIEGFHPNVEQSINPVSPLSVDTPAFTPKAIQNERTTTNVSSPSPPLPAVNQTAADAPKAWGAGKSWASLFTPKGATAGGAQINGVTKFSEAIKETNNNDSKCPIKNPRLNQFIDPDCYRMGEFLTNYTVDGRTISVQPRGLINQSNYCYINSILQALIACPPMYNLLSGLAENMSSNAKRKPTPVIDGMCKFVKEYKHLPANMRVNNRRSEGGKKDQKKDQSALINTDIPFEPSWIYKILRGLQTDLVEGRQEDAEEFLGCLLNNLSDEMLELIKLVNEPEENTKLQQEEEEDSWQVMGNKNKGSVLRKTEFQKTPITDIFGGSLKSRIQRIGGISTENTQPFLTLPLNIEKVKTVREALEALTTKYQLEGLTSANTNEEVEAWQQVMLDELPVVLILHLKCFDFQLDGCTKIVKALEFPIDLKIDTKLLSSSKTANAKEKQYKLFAVVYHDGKEATKGHYITDAFHVGYSSWLRYDDASVKPVQEEQVLNPQGTRVPYLLFYRRSDTIRSR